MTRKRFVKLAMANGYSRNSANRIAEKIPASGKTYAEVYAALGAVKKLAVSIGPALAETMERCLKVIRGMVQGVIAGCSAFLEAYSAAMTEE